MSFLRIIGPASIEVWISSPVRSRKPVLMNTTRSRRGADARLQVDGGAPLLVHDAHLERVARQRQHVLDAGEQLVGEGHFVRPVHLRLDDIDRARAAVAQRRAAAQVVQRDQRGDGAHRGCLRASRCPPHRAPRRCTCGGRHCAPASGCGRAASARRHPAPCSARSGLSVRSIVLPPFSNGRRQRAVHQAEPVAVDLHLVRGIDGRDAVLAIHDRGDGGFQDDVGDARRVVAPDRRACGRSRSRYAARYAAQQDGGAARRPRPHSPRTVAGCSRPTRLPSRSAHREQRRATIA